MVYFTEISRQKDIGNFSDSTKEIRYVREIIFGQKRYRRYWEITTDTATLPENSTWYVMSEVPNLNYKDVGNLYGCRNWVEYALNQSKNELGWSDFRLLNYLSIEKWWEIVSSAYFLVSLFTQPWQESEHLTTNGLGGQVTKYFAKHRQWDTGEGWKNVLNNLSLISLPFICFNLIIPWLKVFPIPQLSLEFPRLIALMNFFSNPIQHPTWPVDYHFSSA